MIIATLLAGAALQVAAPPPPEPPPPPPAAVAPLPPLPPLPPAPPRAPHDGSSVMSFDDHGQHVTIIRRRDGDRGAAFATRGEGEHMLHYKDAEGRDVTVFTDKAITQADAERMERDMRARIPEITAKAMADARVQAAQARAQAQAARIAGDEARRQGEKAREYAQVIVKQMKDGDGRWRFDAGPSTGVFRQGDFAGPADLKALRDEVHALRVEIDELRAQLKSGVTH